MMVSDVTEDSVTLSWIRPLAPFEYYKLSYQSARGSIYYFTRHDELQLQLNEHDIWWQNRPD